MTSELQPGSRLKGDAAAGAALHPVFVRVAPEQIVYLKFILESYEDLGVVRTLNASSGDLVVLALESTHEDTTALLQALSREIPLQLIDPRMVSLGPDGPAPELRSLEGDWLLAEYAAESLKE